ncbi:AbiH family protein [Occultella kanbiaonis]|uniref:AbiH family protein n=1 Tax=Occultella kanbiaonis TaxID=2675754 RepID=UPI0013CFAEDD|nr:AbiH family protein [Occultella kanbiaonis]
MSYPFELLDWHQDQIDSLLRRPTPNPVHTIALIGNGFDLSLGLKCSFNDFKNYFRDLLDADLDDRGDSFAGIYAEISAVTGPDWSNFESELANLNLPSSVAELSYVDEGDLQELDELAADGAEYSGEFRNGLEKVFTSWIRSFPRMAPSPPTPAGKEVVASTDAIVNFNYTMTLGTMLGVSPNKVLHPHGIVDGPAGLHFGCPPPERDPRDAAFNPLSAAVREQALSELRASLTKVHRLELLHAFLEHAEKLKIVNTYGFSFGRADLPYIDAISDAFCDGATVWRQHCYTRGESLSESDDAARCENALASLKFPGRIELVSV